MTSGWRMEAPAIKTQPTSIVAMIPTIAVSARNEDLPGLELCMPGSLVSAPWVFLHQDSKETADLGQTSFFDAGRVSRVGPEPTPRMLDLSGGR